MRAKLGDIEINVVESERLRHPAEITEKPVERGQNIADHMKIGTPSIELVGAIMGEGASDKLNKLKKYQRESMLINYAYRNEYHKVLIEDIGTRHEVQIRDGFEFNITLKQPKISVAQEIEMQVVNPVTKVSSPKTNASVKVETNKGRQQPQEKKVSLPTDYSATPEEALLSGAGPLSNRKSAQDLVDLYKMKPKHSGAGRSFAGGVGGSGSGGF